MKKACLISLFCICCLLPAFARGVTESYLCKVDQEKMPEGAVYVEMLLLSEGENAETPFFNKKNGKKYGISQESEIFLYNKDGFMSYTFRNESAKSTIKPFMRDEDSKQFYVEYLRDEDGYDNGGFSEIDDFGKKYKKAKFAYIDASGNILQVTNEIDIWNEVGYRDIFITLSGETATCQLKGEDSLFHKCANFLKVLFAVLLTMFS